MNKIYYRILFLNCALIFSSFLLATKDQESKPQSLFSQFKEYFYPKDAPASGFLKKFAHEQAKICGIDPESLDIRLNSDQLLACQPPICPALLKFIKPDEKPCIFFNPLLGYIIPVSYYLKNISSIAHSTYGINATLTRHELGHAQQDSAVQNGAYLLTSYLALLKQCSKTLAKHIPKRIQALKLVPLAATASATALEYAVVIPLYSKYKEARADDFAIAHTSEKDYLLATAKLFDWLHTSKLHTLQKEAESSTTKQALLKLAERYPLLFELYYWDDEHPSHLSRAKKFRAAAQLQNPTTTDTENTHHYNIKDEILL